MEKYGYFGFSSYLCSAIALRWAIILKCIRKREALPSVMDSRASFFLRGGGKKLLPLQGDRRATTVTQGDCPGLGGDALSGRIGEGGVRLLPLMTISPWLMALLRRVWARLLPLMTISPWLLPCTAGESSGSPQTRRICCALLSRCRRMAYSAPSAHC